MMGQKFTVYGEMPSMNKIVAASKSHWGGYSKLKGEFTELVVNSSQGLDRMESVAVQCDWYAKDRRTDPDNIAAGVKFILDGLVASNVLDNDGWGQISGIIHTFNVDKDSPRVEITLREAGPNERQD